VQKQTIVNDWSANCSKVDGKFGEGKRKYKLARIIARLKETAECRMAITYW